jgi:hypothetical protein
VGVVVVAQQVPVAGQVERVVAELGMVGESGVGLSDHDAGAHGGAAGRDGPGVAATDVVQRPGGNVGAGQVLAAGVGRPQPGLCRKVWGGVRGEGAGWQVRLHGADAAAGEAIGELESQLLQRVGRGGHHIASHFEEPGECRVDLAADRFEEARHPPGPANGVQPQGLPDNPPESSLLLVITAWCLHQQPQKGGLTVGLGGARRFQVVAGLHGGLPSTAPRSHPKSTE